MKGNTILGGAALMLASTLFFSFKPILVRIGLDQGLEPEPFVVLRLGVAFPLFLITVFAFGLTGQMKLKAKELFYIAIVSIAGMGGAMLFSFYAILYLGASISTLVIFVFPAITTAISYFVNRRPVTLAKVISLATSFVGLAFVVLPIAGNYKTGLGISGFMPALGITYALLAALCWACTQVAFENLAQKSTPFVITVYTTGFMLAFFLGLTGMPALDLEPKTWAVILLLGSVGWYVPFVLAIYAIKIIGASNSSIIQSLGPGVTVLIAWLLLGETLAGEQLLGLGLLIAAVYMLKNESSVVDNQPEQAATPRLEGNQTLQP